MREDVRVARLVARWMIGVTVVLPILLWVSAPGGFGPMSYEPSLIEYAVPALGAAVYLVGLAWMIRIYRRSHIEPQTSAWRYRE